MNFVPRRAASRIVLGGALVLLAACESNTSLEPASDVVAPKPVELTNEFDAAAKVVAVSAADRRVTLRREDGSQFDITCGEAVRNFDQIAVGDTLRVRYREKLGATRLAPGTRLGPVEGALAAGRAAPGEKPGAGAAAGISINVRIESVDVDHDLVVFSLASGEVAARRLRTPQGRDFARGLKVGDVVRLDYAEAVALTVEKT